MVRFKRKKWSILLDNQHSDWEADIAQLMEYRDNLIASVDGDMSKLNGTIYDDIERWIGEIWMLADPETYESLGPLARDTKQIQSILGKKDYSNVMDGLKESYGGDNLNNLVSTLLTEDDKLKEDLHKSGIDDDEFYQYIESTLDPQKHEIEQMREGIQNRFNQDFADDSQKADLDELTQWLNNVQDEDIGLANEIVNSLYSSSWTAEDMEAKLAEWKQSQQVDSILNNEALSEGIQREGQGSDSGHQHFPA